MSLEDFMVAPEDCEELQLLSDERGIEMMLLLRPLTGEALKTLIHKAVHGTDWMVVDLSGQGSGPLLREALGPN